MLALFWYKPPAPTAPPPLSLHDALPIYARRALGDDMRDRGLAREQHVLGVGAERDGQRGEQADALGGDPDRKSTRLNSSHLGTSYAVFCLKKKKENPREIGTPAQERQTK